MEKIVDINEEWALNIGKVFLSFGDLEKLTIDCISKWLDGQSIVNHLVNAPLKQRINIVIDLAQDKYGNCDEVKSFEQHLKMLQKLAEKRNLIAHNPLMMVWYESSIEEEICSLKNENIKFTLSDLHLLVSKAEELYEQLHIDLAKFRLIDDPNLLSVFEGLDLSGQRDTPNK